MISLATQKTLSVENRTLPRGTFYIWLTVPLVNLTIVVLGFFASTWPRATNYSGCLLEVACQKWLCMPDFG